MSVMGGGTTEAEIGFGAATCIGDGFGTGNGRETHAGVDDRIEGRAGAVLAVELTVCEAALVLIFLPKTARKISCFVGDAGRFNEDAKILWDLLRVLFLPHFPLSADLLSFFLGCFSRTASSSRISPRSSDNFLFFLSRDSVLPSTGDLDEHPSMTEGSECQATRKASAASRALLAALVTEVLASKALAWVWESFRSSPESSVTANDNF